jgi:hypothetical protein
MADESYELRHDNNGNAIHVIIKDGDAIVYPTLNDLVRHQYFGESSDRTYLQEEQLEVLYSIGRYNYYELMAEMRNTKDQTPIK